MALFGRTTERDEQRAQAYAEWLQKRNPYAIASVVLGVFSLIEFGVLLIFGIAGIVLGMVALSQLRKVHEQLADARAALAPPGAGGDDESAQPKTHGHRLAWTGIILSALSLVIAAFIYTLPGG